MVKKINSQDKNINFSKFYRNIIVPYSFTSPALLVFIFVILSPVIFSLILSFYKFTGFDSNFFKQFIGAENFRILFHDKFFWISFRNTFYFVIASITVQIAVSLIISIFIFFGNFKNSVLLRTIIFFPAVLAPVAVSLAWRKMLEQDGVINQIFHLNYPWISSVQAAIWVVIFVSLWQWTGYNMVIFYAGLQSVDREILEAADVDGANWWGKIMKIVVPSIFPTIILNIILNLVGSFRVFDIVYVLTRGGPVHSSEVLTTIMYYYSFSANGPNKMGVGSAIAFIMFAIMIIFGILRVRFLKKGV
jgi:raffinose/stachyose/melibiose transport system permease protein